MKKPCNGCEFANNYKYPSGRIKYYPGLYKFVDKKLKYDTPCRDCEKRKKYDEYLESKRRYVQGEQIKSVQEYLDLKRNGETLFYWRDSIRHFGWLESLQFRVLAHSIENGFVCKAVLKQ